MIQFSSGKKGLVKENIDFKNSQYCWAIYRSRIHVDICFTTLGLNDFLINLKNLHRSTIFAAFEVFLFTFKGFHYEAKNGYIGIWYIKNVSEKSFKICSEFSCHKKWKIRWKIPHTGDTVSLDACKAVVDKGLNIFQRAQVSAQVAATHQISQHLTLNSQIQMEGPYDRLA